MCFAVNGILHRVEGCGVVGVFWDFPCLRGTVWIKFFFHICLASFVVSSVLIISGGSRIISQTPYPRTCVYSCFTFLK